MTGKRINRRSFLAKSSSCMVGAGFGIAGLNNPDLRDSLNSGIGDEIKIKEYRILGRTGFKVSDIGCGPVSITDENLLKAILNAGINYIDTAEFYRNGNNERMVGKAIKNFDRKSIFVNTKIMVSDNDTAEAIISKVRKSLERLDVDYMDGVMLWNASSTAEVGNNAFHNAIEQLKREGRVKFCGVSSHGANWDGKTKESMGRVIGAAVEDGRFDLVLFVYNYLQADMGRDILIACEKKNIGATLMKTDPFGGVAMQVLDAVKYYHKDSIPESLANIYARIKERQKSAELILDEKQLSDKKSYREAAIGFVLDNPSVHSVLISFSNYQDIDDYINLSGRPLSAQDLQFINFMKETCGTLYCRHACGLCENKCPNGVPVNTIMRFNHYFMAQGKEKYSMQKYYNLPGSKPDICLLCEGHCEKACPYGVLIRPLLAMAHQNLSIV